jgi:hypothetical protein
MFADCGNLPGAKSLKRTSSGMSGGNALTAGEENKLRPQSGKYHGNIPQNVPCSTMTPVLMICASGRGVKGHCRRSSKSIVAKRK